MKWILTPTSDWTPSNHLTSSAAYKYYHIQWTILKIYQVSNPALLPVPVRWGSGRFAFANECSATEWVKIFDINTSSQQHVVRILDFPVNLHANYVAHHRGVVHRVDLKFLWQTARYENPFGNHLESLVRSLCETISPWMRYVGCTELHTVVRAEFFENLWYHHLHRGGYPSLWPTRVCFLHSCRILLIWYPPSAVLRLKLTTFCWRYSFSYSQRRKNHFESSRFIDHYQTSWVIHYLAL